MSDRRRLVARAGQYHRPNGIVLACVGEGAAQRRHEIHRQAIASLGTIEGHDPDRPPILAQKDVVLVHLRPIPLCQHCRYADLGLGGMRPVIVPSTILA